MGCINSLERFGRVVGWSFVVGESYASCSFVDT